MNNRRSGNPSTANVQREIARQTDELVKKLISEGKISRPNWWVSQAGRTWILAAILGLCTLASVGYQVWLNGLVDASAYPNSSEFASTLFTGAAIFFAYYQWSDGRREASLDKFYDRLALTNTRYYEWREARDVVPHFWGASTDDKDYRPRMYVYLELDNLEYMIIRYQLGYLRLPLFRRAVRTFGSRCESPEFCSIAKEIVNGAGYGEATVNVVKILVAQAEPDNTIHIS